MARKSEEVQVTPAGKAKPSVPDPAVQSVEAPVYVHPISSKRGYFDGIENGFFKGWAWDPSGEGGRAEVELWIDNAFVEKVSSDKFRGDLLENGIGSGDHAFYVTIPQHLYDGQKHSVDIRFSSDGSKLENSPISFAGRHPEVAASGKGGGVPTELFVNPNFSDWKGPFSATVQGGENPLCDGWTIAVAKSDVGTVRYRLEPLDLPPFFARAAEYGLRIHAAGPIAMLRLTGLLRTLDHHLSAPAMLNIGVKCGDGAGLIREISLMLVENGTEKKEKIHSIAKRIYVSRGWAQLQLRIPQHHLGTALSCGRAPLIVIDMEGAVDLTIGPVSLSPAGIVPERKNDARKPAFEDDVIEQQAGAIKGFFDVFAPNIPASEPVVWHARPLSAITEIIVPVHQAREYALACIDAVLGKTDIPYLLTVVDDHSQHTLHQELLARAKGRPWVKIIRNDENLGYTRTINKAVRQSNADFLLFLNSDTEVTEGWLSRMTDVMTSDARVGIVGPLSNAATWQSVPEVKDPTGGWAINEAPSGLSIDSFAQLISKVSERQRPRVKVLNGFCMMVRRQLFDKIGLFDEESFPRGYGEENDLCLRAQEAGFELVLADDVYVFHHKSKSFGAETRAELSSAANDNISRKYGARILKDLGRAMEENQLLTSIRTRISEALLKNVRGL